MSMNDIKREICMLAIFLNAWEEENPKKKSESQTMTWKGYPFDILHQLEMQNLIWQHHRKHLVTLTDEGKRIGKALIKKYIQIEPQQK